MIRIKKPNDIPGLVLWFDANDTSTINNGTVKDNDLVFSFRDKKSNVELTRITPSAGPTYSFSAINGKNVISFQPVYTLGGNASLKGLSNANLTILGSATTSMFCVYKPTDFLVDDTQGNQKYIVNIADSSDLTSGFGNKSIYLGDEGSATVAQRKNPSGRYIEADSSTPAPYNGSVTYHEHIPSRNFLPGSTSSLDKVCMTVARSQKDLKKISFLFENNDYIDDFSAFRTFPNRSKLTGPVYPLSAPQKFILGCYRHISYTYGSRRYPFKGLFCEFLYYDRFLTDDETNIIKTYLKRKWYVEEGEIITETQTSGGGGGGTPVPIAPTVQSTTPISEITDKGAKSGGSILSAGTGTVTARGVCWSTSSGPTIANSKTVDGNGLGSFTSTISGLTLNTLYYVRAYATNSDGLTSYGNQVSFTTLPYVLPVITNFVRRTQSTVGSDGLSVYFGDVVVSSTLVASDGSATFDFNFDSAGGSNIIEYGVVSNSSSNPTVANRKFAYTSVDFASLAATVINGYVSSGETWYFRAYVYNGTHYAYSSNEISLEIADVRLTALLGDLENSRYIMDAIVNETGGLTIQSRGFAIANSSQYDPIYVRLNPAWGQFITVPGTTPGAYSYDFVGFGYAGVRAWVRMNNGVLYYSEPLLSTTL